MTDAHDTKSTTFPRLTAFCAYMRAIRGRSETTIREYHYDISLFFRHLLAERLHLSIDDEAIDLSAVDDACLVSVTLTDMYAFLGHLAGERHNGPAIRARRVAALRAFFTYLCDKVHVVETNEALALEAPKRLLSQPRFLSLEQSQDLLQAADDDDGRFKARDYLMLTLFLNCGLRLSELVGIDLDDIRGDTLIVLGKGGKERTVYLNDACMVALRAYLDERPRAKANDDKALFLSRLGRRMGVRAVQNVIKKYVVAAGLDPKRISTHKLRHTAATLMYQHGHVDLRSLQTILGHKSVATTEIYTHINDAQLHEAVAQNPLARMRPREHTTDERHDRER